MAAKNWCFTLNNPTPQEKILIENIILDPNVNYIICQLEAGTNNTPHYQGFFQLVKKKAISVMKTTFLNSRFHLEVARGSPSQNKDYCSKEPRLEPIIEHGVMRGGSGTRNDIVAFKDAMKEKVLTRAEIIENYSGILAKYPRFVNTLKQHYSETVDPPLVPRPGWQSDLVTYLGGPTDPRKVRWYYDEVGESGKSIFARRYRHNGERAFIITGGKHADIYFAYDRQPVVFFDWPRSNADSFPYSVIETFKNGYFLSTKYESTSVWFTPPHVIVFANFEADRSKLSEDRWDVHNIRNFI